jgi:DNA sulfur modification protein DndB
MATTLAAIHGNFGETEYWLTTMTVGELLRTVRLPKELPDWDDLSIEERYQRDINITRVCKEIAPYFAKDEYRFSGALVVAITDDEEIVFEKWSDIGRESSVPVNYRRAANNVGFLTLPDEAILIPLDGQHRVKALAFAIDGKDDKGEAIPNMRSNPEVRKDQISVILVRFDTVGARRIFNKINRYAKPTAKADNLITDDDDAMAVITRKLLTEDGVIPARLVKIGANTLNKVAPEFTTLATFYNANVAIVERLGLSGTVRPSQINPDQRELVSERLRDYWQGLLSRIELWVKAISDPTEKGDDIRRKIRETCLLGKPVGQLALVLGYLYMLDRCKGVSEPDLCARLNRINWDVEEIMWRGVLMNPNGRIMSGKSTVNRASQFIAHLGGMELSEEERVGLLDHIYGDESKNNELPSPVDAND